ncbi:MAG: DNA repair protein RadC [Eubacterium sp.]|nr:DNA repair protein RadC [Eubacterium sp.]
MNSLRIKDMADSEKPVEKLLSGGAEVMSDAELLAIILRSGTREHSAIQLAQLILNSNPVYKGLPGLCYSSPDQLMKIRGVGMTKACQIIALTEISKRISSEKFKSSLCLNDSQSVASYFMEKTRFLNKERVYALFMTASNSVIKEILVSSGSIDRSLLSVRDLLAEALKCDAVSMVILHNHPSGNPEPSLEDIAVSRNIMQAGEVLGIRLLDHIIVGDRVYVSLKERELL